MDIKSIQPTAQVGYTLDLGPGKAETINLTVAFIALDEVGDHLPGPGKPAKFSAVARALLIDAVTGWDLTENGQPIICNPANKEKYLPIILGLRVKDAEPANPLDAVLGRSLLFFASSPENFLKN